MNHSDHKKICFKIVFSRIFIFSSLTCSSPTIDDELDDGATCPLCAKIFKGFYSFSGQKPTEKNNENYSADYIEEHAEHCGQRIFDVEERRERARADLGMFFFC